MRSEPRGAGSAPRASRYGWLASQGLGVLCGQATALLLAIGSVVLAATRDGASAAIGMDDLRGFFAPASPAHLWFYLLVPVLALYALNTGLATWQNVARRWRLGLRAPHAYAPAVVHLAFLVGLLAHGIGGLASREGGRLLVGPGFTPLGDGREARVTALDLAQHPDGTLEQVRATLELRGADGGLSEARVRYNAPLSRGFGADLWLLVRPASAPVVRLERGGERCEIAPRGACALADVHAELLLLHPPLGPGQAGFARLRVRREGAQAVQMLSLAPGQSVPLDDASLLALEAIEPRPAILLQHRRAPGNPVALLASALLALGLALMWRRFLPGRGAA